MKKPASLVFLLTFALLFLWPLPSHAAVSIDRAELTGSNLRVEGDNAVRNATISIDGVNRGRADDRGEFRIEVSGFSSPTCRISVDDGTGAVTANLSGCTPTSTEPSPEPEPTPVTASVISLNPGTVTGGSTSTATITLSAAAPTGGAQVSLASSNPAVATVPAGVTVPAGSTSTTATVSTTAVTATSSAVISATYGGVTRSATLTVNAPATEPAPVTMSSVGLNPSTVTGGSSSTATVTLSAAAPTGGAEVSLASSNTSVATVPASVTVPAGFRATTVTVSTSAVTSSSSASISAAYGGVTRSATLTVDAAPAETVSLSDFTATPTTLHPDETAQGVVTLTGPAPSGGATVSLFNSNTGIVRVPPSVLVAAGETTASFTITAANASTSTATITASYGGTSRSVTMSVTPTEAGQSLDAVTISPTTVIGGEPADGRVSFTAQVASDTVVSLSSSNTSLVTVPATVTVPTGSAFVHFAITTHAVTAPATATITATHGGVERSATISLTPPPADGTTVSSVTFSPSTLEGGAPATGTVTLAAPSVDGDVIRLTSSHPALVQVQNELVFNPGSSSEAFAVTTSTSAEDVQVTITATPGCCGGAGAGSGVLSVTRTTAPPVTDTIDITRIQWRRCILSVEATGTNHDAILTLHLASSGSEVLELTNLGDGEWEGSRALRPPGSNVPVEFELRSNFGGRDRATVSDSRAGACRGDL